MQAIAGGRARLGYDARSGGARAGRRRTVPVSGPALTVRELDPRDRPREKLVRAGATGLGDNEIIAVLLGSGVPSHCALALSRDVLRLAGGLAGLSSLGFDQLRQITGIGMSRAARLLAALELGRRALTMGRGERRRFATPTELAEYLLPLYGGHHVERFGVVLFDGKGRLIRATILSIGSADAALVHPREVFREAMVASAAAMVVFHNHPSGDPFPSPEDRVLTQRLMLAGEVVGIRMIDHIILGEGRWYSFRDVTRLRTGKDGLDIAL